MADHGQNGMDAVQESPNAEEETRELFDNVNQKQEDEARNYQAALLELAKERNLIICLPTGSGKTYIALQLAKHHLPNAIADNKHIVFLATTVPLVHQQAKYFRANIYNTTVHEETGVRPFTGAMNVDNWTRTKWQREFSKFQILVMTPQIFLDLLNHAHITFEKVCLLILDECHNAGKDHPMSKIMELYRTCAIELGDSYVPRVLGLTATIIRGVGNNISHEVKEIEEIMSSRAVTYHDYEEVLKFSTNALLEYKYFKEEGEESYMIQIKWVLFPLHQTIEVLNGEAQYAAVQSSTPTPNGTLFTKKANAVKEFVNVLTGIINLCNDLGLYCARLGACLKRAFLSIPVNNDSNRTASNRLLTLMAITQFLVRVEYIIGPSDKAFQITFVSPKLQALMDLLSEYKPSRGEKDKLCGITFTQKRLTAQILSWYFEDVVKYGGERYKFIRAAFVIGSSNITDITEARITAQKQATVVQLFHERKYNLVFATSVLEEGLDVPMCNLVVRFDAIVSYPSYVQSMGRARQRGARFVVLAEETPSEARKKQLSSCTKFEKYNGHLSDYLRENALHVDEENDKNIVPLDDEVIPPFCPGGTASSPRVTALSAIPLVQQYCAYLPTDRFVALRPVSWWIEIPMPDGQPLYQAFVRLPHNAVVRELIVGPPMDTRVLAKRSVHLETCKRLYELNGLDENLTPIRNPLPVEVLDFLRQIRAGEIVVPTVKFPWYKKKMPQFYNRGLIGPGVAFDAFVVHLKVKDPSSISDDSLYNFEAKRYRFGIILPKHVGTFVGFEFEGKFGLMRVTFEKVLLTNQSEHGFTQEQIGSLQSFHLALFGKILDIQLTCARTAEASRTYVVPLAKDDSGTSYSLAWNLVTKLCTVDDVLFYRKPTPEQMNNWILEDSYEDSVIVPYYRSGAPLFYNVMSVYPGRTIYSKFEESDEFPDYKTYYETKYSLTAKYENQPLLKCSLVSKQRNFLSAKFDNCKISMEERKAYRETVVCLVPEFTRKYPIPSSLYVQARFIPSILHRMNRVLLAEQLKVEVASRFDWKTAMEPECRNYWKADDTAIVSSLKNIQVGNEVSKSDTLSATQGTSSVACKRASSAISDTEETELYLDYIHPDALTKENIERIAMCKRNKVDVEVEDDFHQVSSRSYKICLSDINQPQETVKNLDSKTDFSQNPGPSSYVIMEAMTVSNANDSLSLERMETMGDSFLKYCVSVQLYCEFQNSDEGSLTLIRSQLISNKHLFARGSAKNIGEFLAGGIFDPLSTWLPPGFQIPEGLCKAAAEADSNLGAFSRLYYADVEAMPYEDRVNLLKEKRNCVNGPQANTTYEFSKVGNKSIADCIEALIGAYFTNGGQDSALRFMEWLDMGVMVNGVMKRYGTWTIPQPQRNFENQNLTVKKFMPFLEQLEAIICYRFKDPWLVVEAFTHPTYLANSVTRCYQRLEFLGDAVLDLRVVDFIKLKLSVFRRYSDLVLETIPNSDVEDLADYFLVTAHIFHMPRKCGKPPLTPGELTDLRSALVNNITFGSLVVRYGFHKYLLAVSSELQDSINVFEGYQESNNHEVTGHFSLLTDMESPVAEDVQVPKVLGDLFESLAGAVYLDTGMKLDATWKVFYRLLQREIERFSDDVPISPIRRIHENFPGNVEFKSLAEELNSKIPHYKGTIVRLKIRDKVYFGSGPSKSSAKNAAAKLALQSSKETLRTKK